MCLRFSTVSSITRATSSLVICIPAESGGSPSIDVDRPCGAAAVIRAGLNTVQSRSLAVTNFSIARWSLEK